MTAVLLVAAAYGVGSVPFGLLLARAWGGGDIRQRGSGNIGATNVLRTVGKKAGALTLAADTLKGLVLVLVVRAALEGAGIRGEGETILLALVALGVVLGHMFSLFTGFQGGKGVATSLGAFLALMPLACLVAAAVWFLLVGLSRRVSLGSMGGAAALAVAGAAAGYPAPYGIVSALVGALIILRHKTNIERLLSGQEPKLGQRA